MQVWCLQIKKNRVTNAEFKMTFHSLKIRFRMFLVLLSVNKSQRYKKEDVVWLPMRQLSTKDQNDTH